MGIRDGQINCLAAAGVFSLVSFVLSIFFVGGGGVCIRGGVAILSFLFSTSSIEWEKIDGSQ